MTEKLVTIATFSHPPEAHLRRAKLESEGISAFIADENTIAANWLYSNAIGGVKLQVHEADVERALEVLSMETDASTAAPNEESDVRCPFCGSGNVQYGRDRPLILDLIMRIFSHREWYCRDCGHEWRQYELP